MISLRLLCGVLLVWMTLHIPFSTPAMVMDGEAFLKQDFEDAVSFKSVLKEQGIELPDKPRERAEEEMVHLQRRRRKRPTVTSSKTTTAATSSKAKAHKTGRGSDTTSSSTGGAGSTRSDTRRRTRKQRPAQTFAKASTEDARVRTDGCERIIWAMAVFKEWDLPESKAAALYTRLQVALLSARVHAPSLVPVLLYDGTPNAFTAWWETSGAEYKEYGNPVTGGRIVFAYTSMYKDLSSHKGIYDDTQQHTRTCRGSFLFLDIPDLMPNMTRGLPDDVSREYVLFTSPDVLFLQDINSCNLGTPSIMSVGRDHQDSGGLSLDVAYVNVDGLGAMYNKLHRSALKHRFQQPNCVQGLVFGAIPERDVEILPSEYHWKGYWGSSKDVALVDFYGPKPLDCLPCLTEFPEEAHLCKARCDATAIALFGFTQDMGVYYKWLMHVYHAFVETPVRFVPYNP